MTTIINHIEIIQLHVSIARMLQLNCLSQNTGYCPRKKGLHQIGITLSMLKTISLFSNQAVDFVNFRFCGEVYHGHG